MFSAAAADGAGRVVRLAGQRRDTRLRPLYTIAVQRSRSETSRVCFTLGARCHCEYIHGAERHSGGEERPICHCEGPEALKQSPGHFSGETASLDRLVPSRSGQASFLLAVTGHKAPSLVGPPAEGTDAISQTGSRWSPDHRPPTACFPSAAVRRPAGAASGSSLSVELRHSVGAGWPSLCLSCGLCDSCVHAMMQAEDSNEPHAPSVAPSSSDSGFPV